MVLTLNFWFRWPMAKGEGVDGRWETSPPTRSKTKKRSLPTKITTTKKQAINQDKCVLDHDETTPTASVGSCRHRLFGAISGFCQSWR